MLYSYKAMKPVTEAGTWIAESADVIGNVYLAKNASIWYQSVIRGDAGKISIGKDTNIQDQCVLHSDPEHELTIGEGVSIGHGAIIHGCCIHEHCLIGMGAVIMNGANIEPYSIIAAGAVVLENTVIPSGSLVVGCPAKVIKSLSGAQRQQIIKNAQHYAELKEAHRESRELNG